jgi:hypothetical protein
MLLEESTHERNQFFGLSAHCVVHDLGVPQDAQGTEDCFVWIANDVPGLRTDHISIGRTLPRVPPTS